MVRARADDTRPWKKKNPKQASGQPSRRLTGRQKQEAKARAKAAGRPYPNLVDNMAVARRRTRTAKKTTARKAR